MTAFYGFLKFLFVFFLNEIAFLHDFALDILQFEHIWFLAPLSWMINTYIGIYMHRRTSLQPPIPPLIVSARKVKDNNGRTNKHKSTNRCVLKTSTASNHLPRHLRWNMLNGCHGKKYRNQNCYD